MKILIEQIFGIDFATPRLPGQLPPLTSRYATEPAWFWSNPQFSSYVVLPSAITSSYSIYNYVGRRMKVKLTNSYDQWSNVNFRQRLFSEIAFAFDLAVEALWNIWHQDVDQFTDSENHMLQMPDTKTKD